tara:strand:- start:9688 stop:10866 length:1179 start_codon:yes stop_codon:yes gene_type:complete
VDAKLQIIGQEWKARSHELADWALACLVNRFDVWGQYTGKSGANKAITLPQKAMRDGRDMVTTEKLKRHFGSMRRNHLIGLHSQSADETCKWLAIDIDLHECEPSVMEESASRNFAAARGWWEALVARGFDPLLLDSNGGGGYHLWLLLEEPTPMQSAYVFAQELVADWQSRNLDACPETFPKSPRLGHDKMGAWLRLPGLHHSHNHYSRVWSGDEWLEDPWLDGNEAIGVILETNPGIIPIIENVAQACKGSPGRKRTAPATKSRKRPRICVDLDGVLATYDGWKGARHFGKPIEGSVEFTEELAEWADVVVFSSRCHRADNQYSIEERVSFVRNWLDEHGFAYHEIYSGQGKPFATAYIDDRGVSCQPQHRGPVAFQDAIAAAKALHERP